MSNTIKMIAAEGSTSSSKDELELLVSAQHTGRLAEAIIDKLYHNHPKLFNSLINANPKHPGEYSFSLIDRAFAEDTVANTRLNKGISRYFLVPKAKYQFNSVDLFLNREWYAISRAKPTVNRNWLSINDLVRVLNLSFNAFFVYVELDGEHQLWGPSGTL